MKTCDVCGKPTAGGTYIGRARVCRECRPRLVFEIEKERAEGKSVDAQAIARRLFREEHSAGNYLLRDIPEELWTAAKHQAVKEGLSLREMLLKALHEYVSRNGE